MPNPAVIFSASFSAVAVSAAQDLFELVAPNASGYVTLREIRIGQYSDAGDSEAELLSIQLIRGYTTSGSGGASVTPVNLRPWSRAATATVERNNTTVAQDGTGSIIIADAFNVQGGWWYRPPQDERIYLKGTVAAQARLVCRITVPADAVTMNGTMIFEESNPG